MWFRKILNYILFITYLIFEYINVNKYILNTFQNQVRHICGICVMRCVQSSFFASQENVVMQEMLTDLVSYNNTF